MRLKQKPEDFSVKESYRFDPVDDGDYRVYMMDKQKLSTLEALAKIRAKFGLKPDAISFCGLKDKQGRTEQLIAVFGKDVEWQDELLRLKFLGYTDQPLSARNTTSNRFAVTARAVLQGELDKLTIAAAEVERLGVVNYFDSQRFGAIKHGQGYIAKDLLRGDFEAAMRNYLAKPSELDRSEDARVKQFWKENWGDWAARCPFEGNQKYFRVLRQLRKDPKNFLEAFLQIDQKYRALILFEWQSWVWNEGVRRLLQLTLPREHLFVMPYQAGTLLFHRDADPKVLSYLRTVQFPLLGPDSTFTDEKVREAAMWALGKEKFKLNELVIPGAKGRLFFKHEPRPALVTPEKFVVGKPRPDEINRGKIKVNIAFTLPPGSYATLVVKRLFHFTERQEGPGGDSVFAPPPSTSERPTNPDRPQFDDRARPGHRAGPLSSKPQDRRDDRGRREAPPSRRDGPTRPDRPSALPTKTPYTREKPLGFRAQAKAQKELKAQRRAEAKKRP